MKIVRRADDNDILRLHAFLLKSKLEVSNLEEKIESFFLLTNSNDELYAASGYVIVDNHVVLRTSAIDSNLAIEEILQFFRDILKNLSNQGVLDVYLCAGSESSANFFSALGFKRLNSEEVEKIVDIFSNQSDMPDGNAWLGYVFN
jgi:N-acetylglutamate synthase-like GNAT family acetyltransferase